VKLHEFQSKAILARHGVPVPHGAVAGSAAEAAEVARQLGRPVVVKAQVLVGGRGKAGGILLAETDAQAAERARAILGLTIGGLPVTRVLVEEAAEIERELYLGLVVDRAAGCVVIMASGQGGVDIEEVARCAPGQIGRLSIDPFLGLRDYQVRYLASFLDLPRPAWFAFVQIAQALYEAFTACDASLAEINPLTLTRAGTLLALDAKINLDDNALFRHPDLEALRNADEESPAEAQARAAGLSYVSLEGNIGCMVNGAGLAMATLDAIKAFGGMPANFLDIGGGARAERVSAALELILQDPRVRAVLLSIFGGITRCDEVAEGIAGAISRVRPEESRKAVPIVARLVGTNEVEGQAILARVEGIHTAHSLSDAARLVVTMTGEG
jgi:succinyl-CoA synthetase beta subunit